jgi:hypothetical protein
LFSDERVVRFLKENFVCAWESVRPVPKVTIDFGDGRALSRTVNGNIAFYFCTPDGHVLDVVPGINTPEAFLEDARRALDLARVVRRIGLEPAVRDYHTLARTTAVKINPPSERSFASKMAIEKPIKKIFEPAPPAPQEPPDRGKELIEIPVKKSVMTAEERRLLEEDTEINRRERMPAIHAVLAETPRVKPADIYKRLYKEILRCDLDDPYLGLLPDVFNRGAVNH